MLRDGVDVEYPRSDGSIKRDKVLLVDFTDVRANDWLAVNQFTVIEGQHNRRPDIVVFVNGLPLGLIELKNAVNEETDIWSAYAQLQTYKAEITTLLHYNAALVVSDGLQARMGSVTANQEWFKVWRTIDGEGDAPKTALELEVLVRGVFERQRFLELLEKLLKDELKVRSKRNLVQSQVFSEKLKKTLNAYHNRAISTMQVIEELIKLAKDLDAATKRGVDLGLTDDEVAFYDALACNDSAVLALGDDKLKFIAAELIAQVKKSVTIDWTLRESARARIKVMVKRILNRHGYPPDLEAEAVRTVLAQAELLCAEWV